MMREKIPILVRDAGALVDQAALLEFGELQDSRATA
jgi:hypothetical protein